MTMPSLPELPERNTTEEQTNAELERLDGWEKIYAKTHPMPQPPARLSFWKTMGLEAGILYAASLGGILLAAVRTGAIFAIAETLLLAQMGVESWLVGWVPIAVMFFALFAFEGYLFGVGLIQGKESHRVKNSWWGLLIAFSVSAIAGIASSLPIVGISDATTGTAGIIYLGLEWILVLASGVGATFMAYLGAHNLGVLYNKFGSIVEGQKLEYVHKRTEWFSQMQSDYRRAGRSAVFATETWGRAAASGHSSASGEATHSIKKTVEQYLLVNSISAFQVGDKPGALITPAKIAQDLGIEPVNVRIALSRLRKDVDPHVTENGG